MGSKHIPNIQKIYQIHDKNRISRKGHGLWVNFKQQVRIGQHCGRN